MFYPDELPNKKSTNKNLRDCHETAIQNLVLSMESNLHDLSNFPKEITPKSLRKSLGGVLQHLLKNMFKQTLAQFQQEHIDIMHRYANICPVDQKSQGLGQCTEKNEVYLSYRWAHYTINTSYTFNVWSFASMKRYRVHWCSQSRKCCQVLSL